jgi:predicted DNA-binding ribbon-helix-helix protein
MPNKSKLTVVKSLRASKEFWDKADKTAKKEKTDRNKLIVKVVSEYLNEVENGRK